MTRIVTYNIQFGVGRDGRPDLSRTIEALRGADIACLQEIEKGWRRDGDIDQPEKIAAAFPGYWYVFAPGLNVHWSPLRPTDGHRPGFRRQNGDMILSRHPIRDTRTYLLPRRPSQISSQQRVLLEAVIDDPSGPFRLYTTHLCHLGPETREAQIRYILATVEDHGRGPTWTGTIFPEAGWDNGEPQPPWPEDFIFCGDLNVLPDSTEYAMFAARWRDAAVQLGADPAPTFIMPGDTTRRLDYFFVSPGIARRLKSYDVDPTCVASDHLPVAIEVSAT
jgi:endonuclease/exonuclease/phosphatase family metal-dependent hydrolase